MIGLCDSIIKEAFVSEVVATIKHKMKHTFSDDEVTSNIQYFLNNKYDEMDNTLVTIAITVSYDMGWQKRATGNIYDSLSGHGFYIGIHTQKIVDYGVMGKRCMKCDIAERNGDIVEKHICTANWTGSSGSMEAGLALKMANRIFDNTGGRVHVGAIISDDDTTMRSQLHNIRHGGKLGDHIPQPVFYADVGHRVKVMCKPFFAMVTTSKDPSQCKMIDALRLKRYTGYYLRQNRTKDLCQFVANARAPVEHLFNNHQWCNEQWCWAKGISVTHHGLISKMMAAKEISSNASFPPTVSTPLLQIAPSTEDMIEDSDYTLDSDSDDSLLPEGIDDVSDEETNNCETVDLFEDKFGKEHMHFSPNEMEELKVKEKELMERNASSYYRCKIKHAKLYAEITAAYTPFITKEMLVMLHHTGDTQKTRQLMQALRPMHQKEKLTAKLLL